MIKDSIYRSSPLLYHYYSIDFNDGMDIKTREGRFLKLKPKLELSELDMYLFLAVKMTAIYD